MMKEIKIYLDTTIPNYAFNDHTPEKQKIAQILFRKISRGEFESFISSVVLDEISDASASKRTKMLKLLEDFQVLEITDEVRNLAKEYIKQKIIPEKHIEDALHIAVATVNNIEVIVSYNYEHIVKRKTKIMVNGINLLKGYNTPDIVMPEEVI